MSNLLSEDGTQSPGPQQDRERQEENGEYAWLGADAICQFFARKRKKCQSNENVSGRVSNAILNGSKFLLLCILAAVAIWAISRPGWIDSSEKIVALFTAALFVVAGLQWWITGRQVQQTEQTLELMRNGQRPWVAIVNPFLKKSGVTNRPDLSFRFENTGPSPGVVLGISLIMFRTRNIHAKEQWEEVAEVQGEFQRAVSVVPPNAGCDHTHVQIDLTEYDYETMSEEDGWVCIVGSFAYLGPGSDSLYRTGFAFAFRSDGKLRVVGTYQNNYMK